MSNILMSSLFALLLTACASRGYKGLQTEVPELFPGFKPEEYVKKETPKNIMYVEKKLPAEELEKEEFYKEDYIKTNQPDSYSYYTPNNRLPGFKDFFKDMERVITTHDENVKAVLVK